MNNIGTKIAQTRKVKGLSQEKLADKSTFEPFKE
jgi:transcriptional regulator with XRE-family HTH domain